MTKMLNISGWVEVYDVEKFRNWLFETLQELDFVGGFDINTIESEDKNNQ